MVSGAPYVFVSQPASRDCDSPSFPRSELSGMRELKCLATSPQVVLLLFLRHVLSTSYRASSHDDAAIRRADPDSALARLSAVKNSCLGDPFIRHLVARPHLQPARPPLINIGTFVRSESTDRLVLQQIKSSQLHGIKCQIANLTWFWRLAVRACKLDPVTSIDCHG